MEAEYACADNRSHNINSAENSKLYHIYLKKMEKEGILKVRKNHFELADKE